MRASLVIATYNWTEALALTLESAARQTVAPSEVLVADDGSRPDTGELIERLRAGYPVPLIHVRQEDRGFRLARIRNLAVARASGDYLIQIDGDLLLHRRFVADQTGAARRGHFVRCSRAFLSPAQTAAVLAGGPAPAWWAGGLGKRWAALRLPLLSRLLLDRELDRLDGHYLSYWREDALRVNGYEERFEGWGREDDELAARLMNAGLRKRRLRFAAVNRHLYHQATPRPGLEGNERILLETLRDRRVRAEVGLDQHLI